MLCPKPFETGNAFYASCSIYTIYPVTHYVRHMKRLSRLVNTKRTEDIA